MFRERDARTSLFSTSHLLPDEKRRRLEEGWPGEFRRSALPLIDEDAFRDLYHEWNGRPNKPVQIVVGVLLLKEMHDLTDGEALFNLDFNLAWHVALDLEPEEARTRRKTSHNFRAKVVASDKGRLLFEGMTARIIRALGVSTGRQRLDSTPAGPEGSAERTARAHRLERGDPDEARALPRDGARLPEGAPEGVEGEVRRRPGGVARAVCQGRRRGFVP